VVSILRNLSPGVFKGEISFAHDRPIDTSEHLRIFGRAVFFGRPENQLAFEHTYLERPIAPADEELLVVLDRYAERLLSRVRQTQTWSGKVAELLTRSLCDGRPSLPEVARLLAVSQRSLQAKLKDESTSYQAILDNVRLQVATDYLEDATVSLTEIAFLLGFADQSAFTHAFRKWSGVSPARYRESTQHRE